MSAFVARQVVGYAGPYPYIDGLLLQVTQRIGSIIVRHDPRRAGASGYTLRRLVRLWLSAWLNFSLLPLRVATVRRPPHRGGRARRASPWSSWLWLRESRTRLRVGMGDGGGAGVLRHAARACSA